MPLLKAPKCGGMVEDMELGAFIVMSFSMFVAAMSRRVSEKFPFDPALPRQQKNYEDHVPNGLIRTALPVAADSRPAKTATWLAMAMSSVQRTLSLPRMAATKL